MQALSCSSQSKIHGAAPFYIDDSAALITFLEMRAQGSSSA